MEVNAIGLDLQLLKGEWDLGWLAEFLPGQLSVSHAVPKAVSCACIGGRWMVEMGDLGGLIQPWGFYDSVLLRASTPVRS